MLMYPAVTVPNLTLLRLNHVTFGTVMLSLSLTLTRSSLLPAQDNSSNNN